MTWFKVDDHLHAHPKWLAASPEARALWTTAGSWCAAYLTDGRVPTHVLPLLGGRSRDADELVRNGLWEPIDGGWTFHDWADFQPSADQVEGERAAARERQQRARTRQSRRDNGRDIRRDSGRDSRRDIAVTSPSRDNAVTSPSPGPGPNHTYLGGDARTHEPPPNEPPPRRCVTHADWADADIPPCGPCADARRAHDAWLTTRRPDPNTKPDPYAAQRAALGDQVKRNRAREADAPTIDVNRNLAGAAGARDALRHPTPRYVQED